MAKRARKVKRSASKRASAKQIAAKRTLAVQAALRSLTLAAGDISVKNLFSGAPARRMMRASGVVHDWNDKDTRDKHIRWDDDPNDPFKTLPKIENF